MISVDDALTQVAAQISPLPKRRTPIEQALDHVLAENVASDIDSPPHDKSIVDGYAVRSADIGPGETTLTILEEVTAGAVPRIAVAAGTATRIMTGAPLPNGADAVVMIEQTQWLASGDSPLGQVQVKLPRIVSGKNILRRATSMRRGETVLRAGHPLRPVEIGLLAEVGRTAVEVFGRPTVAVLPTGDELTPPGEVPSAGQIRNSNGPMLLAAVRRAGGEPVELGIGRDDRASLRRLIGAGLRCDVLLVSGGVSAGVRDLAPAVLDELGVRQVFHKVRLKPGKPLWFGVHQGGERSTLVFGLPGNPVSGLVCFELFVLPTLRALAGRAFAPRRTLPARLAADFQQRGDRATYFPARLTEAAGSSLVEPLDWQGSGDLRTLAEANALVCFAPGDRLFKAQELVEIVRLD